MGFVNGKAVSSGTIYCEDVKEINLGKYNKLDGCSLFRDKHKGCEIYYIIRRNDLEINKDGNEIIWWENQSVIEWKFGKNKRPNVVGSKKPNVVENKRTNVGEVNKRFIDRMSKIGWEIRYGIMLLVVFKFGEKWDEKEWIESVTNNIESASNNGEPIMYVINNDDEKPVKVCMEGEIIMGNDIDIGIGGNGEFGVYKKEDLKNG